MNVVHKDFRKVELKIALCYPNLYPAAIACYAVQLLYGLFNSFENVQCERFFYTPKTPPHSIESGQPLNKFDIVCFSLQFELDYMNLLEMLLNAGIPQYANKRQSPLIIIGGPCVLENPLPLCAFIDIAVLGDIEPIVDQLLSYLIEFKKGQKTLHDFLEIPGLFIPQLYRDESISKLTAPKLDECYHPTAQIISDASSFGESFLLEVTRGCPRGCRFCLIGYQGLPTRFRSLPILKEIILEGITNSKVDKITLIGSSLSDYPHLTDLCEFIVDQGLKLSLPSIRIDVISDSLLEILKKVGVKTLTTAPEAGSNRLRSLIGKEISEDNIINGLIKCANAKIENIKLYFLINLPKETSQDIDDLKKLLQRIIREAYRPYDLNLSINPFIPKPHTPFQWAPPVSVSYNQQTIKTIQKFLKPLKIYNFEFLDPRWARIQGFLSRGSKQLGDILVKVIANRGTLGAWRKVLKLHNISIEAAQTFPPALEAVLPWDFIDVGVSKERLLAIYQKLF
ncbi:MAG TPA: radical SAM protein [Candidatus Deferrimicrobium sp.]|nr:radical SAM protein [Candidatus Deferrimicrobium sp.]